MATSSTTVLAPPETPAPPEHRRGRAVLGRVIAVGVFLMASGIPMLPHFATLEPLFFPLRLLQNHTFEIGSVAFGAYPEPGAIAELKAEGYEEIVVLLTPSLPQERSLIGKELAACRRLRMKCTTMPLSFIPRVHTPQNYAHAAAIAEYIAGRRVYVHCYLGMHRAILVAETLEGARNADGPVPPRRARFAR